MSHIQNDIFIEHLIDHAFELLEENRMEEFDELCREARSHGYDIPKIIKLRQEIYEQSANDYKEMQGWNVKQKKHA